MVTIAWLFFNTTSAGPPVMVIPLKDTGLALKLASEICCFFLRLGKHVSSHVLGHSRVQ